MRRSHRAGFTLIELVIAVLLSSVVLIALASILTQLVLAQVSSARSQTVQLNLTAVDQLIERELRKASLVSQPAFAGVPSGALEGCDNATLSPTPPSPAPIDPNAPMSWFAFCAAGGDVYYHSGAGCPANYACGTSPTAAFAWPQPWSSISFLRPSAGSTLVTAVLSAASGSGPVVTSKTAVAFSAPAGGAQ